MLNKEQTLVLATLRHWVREAEITELKGAHIYSLCGYPQYLRREKIEDLTLDDCRLINYYLNEQINDEPYPFNTSWRHYIQEVRGSVCHINPLRKTFVLSQIEQLEKLNE